MTEIVVAVFETSSSADAAVEDLTAARIPSAAVQRGGSHSALPVWHRNANRWQMPMVTVAVDEMHANAVTGILKQHGPVNLEVREAQSRRR
jgi:hypothetical protein